MSRILYVFVTIGWDGIIIFLRKDFSSYRGVSVVLI